MKTGLNEFQPNRIPTIYIGGGTPSLIPADILNIFLSKITELSGPVDEFTIEVNPESLTEDFISALGSIRAINRRISMGVQTYNENLLTWLGRPAGKDAFANADNLLQTHWNDQVNRDILAALPRQPGQLSNELKHALADEPGHISLYELTVEAGTALSRDPQRLQALPDEEFKVCEWQEAVAFLDSSGYKRYEVSNFAIPGRECRHNMIYWQLDAWLGLGPSAVSNLRNGVVVERITEPYDLLKWLKGTPANREILTVREYIFEHFLMGWRTARGLSLKHFENVFGLNPLTLIPQTVDNLIKSGYLKICDDHMSVAPHGLDILDSILLKVMTELDSQQIHIPGSNYMEIKNS